ncbi:MAG: response regulator [Desulfobacteraceae bacterium]|nr:MAG: response regulator [Desulfobacteraceae bacterium]
MDKLIDFAAQELPDQIRILQDIEQTQNQEAVFPLFKILEKIPDKDPIHYLVKNTLHTLLAQNEEKTIQGLASENALTRKICIFVSGQRQFRSAGPALVDLALREKDPALLLEILSALAQIKPVEALKIFRDHATDSAPLIAALSIEMLGNYADADAIEILCQIITESESEQRYEECEWTTAKAIESLAKLGAKPAIAFLVSRLHHKNPTARRMIHEKLIEIGAPAIPLLADISVKGDKDQKLFAARIMGAIGDKAGGEALVKTLDQCDADDLNLKVTIYEALGQVSFLKGLICLVDGLSNEKQDLALMAIVTSLNQQANPGVTNKIKELIAPDTAQSRKIIQTVIAAKAVQLFEALYEDPGIAQKMMNQIVESNDEEIIATFRQKLKMIANTRSQADALLLEKLTVAKEGIKILVVDDSASMLLFYRNILAELNAAVTTAENGKQALDHLSGGQTFDLIITDINMPIMDGVALTREIRSDPYSADIPIIMVTNESENSQATLAKKTGINGFVIKPFTPDSLIKKIKEFL